jgi:phosphoglycerate dehydrogenase-like enzyme
MAYQISCLDTWPDKVKQILLGCAPEEFNLTFADSYDFEHQAALIQHADAILPGWAMVTEELLQRAERLKFVQKWGIGIDRIDQDALRRRNIPLAITAGANAHPVAELAITLLLAVYRRIYYNNTIMRLGKWPKDEMRETCYQIYGKKVGIVGLPPNEMLFL